MMKSQKPAKNQTPWGLHWFRRDLRIADNKALKTNWRATGGRTLGLFSFDSQFLSRDDFSPNRFAFFLSTLRSLKKEMQALGGDLLVVDAMPDQALPQILKFMEKHAGACSLVTWNRDYEPYARKRDEQVHKILQELGIPVETFRDHLIFEPYEVLKSEKPGDFYQVYSPYAKKWFRMLHEEEGQNRLKSEKSFKHEFVLNWKSFLKLSDFPYYDALDEFEKKNKAYVTVPIPDAGFEVAHSKLLEFKPKITDYKTNRDFPSLLGTSRLSLYLKNGSLTTSQILHTLKLGKTEWDGNEGVSQYVKEIAWREFYYSILFHRPDVETSAFHKQYKDLKWENNKAWFKRWQEGTTGFPIVDAGMRELLATGWMHNRVRMIVASFLTKDLLIDWRWGEKHFMKYLLDGDLAPNNGGWQWAASTGCDPQPYFRVFNPWLQSERFDPDGEYIKTYVPELRPAPAKTLHDPEFDRRGWKYPAPIVEHGERRDLAIRVYKAANGK